MVGVPDHVPRSAVSVEASIALPLSDGAAVDYVTRRADCHLLRHHRRLQPGNGDLE